MLHLRRNPSVNTFLTIYFLALLYARHTSARAQDRGPVHGTRSQHREVGRAIRCRDNTTSPSMIAEPALTCQASEAIFLKRFVQSLPRRVLAHTLTQIRV